MLQRFGCTDVQGYLLSPPVSLEQFRAMLNQELERPRRDQSG
jgi:EAL domain-containing protein (putative c-di-GMP-specific phosphodiesterase class I)